MVALPLICLPASSPRIVTGRRSSFGVGSLPATLVFGEIIDDGILLPVT